MTRSLLILFIFAFLSYAEGRQFHYTASEIPESLKENSNAVVRLDETEFEIIHEEKTKLKRHIVVTILNELGEHHAELVLPYSEGLSEIKSIEGKVYNSAGKEIDQLRKSEIEDIGSQDGLISDNRYKIASLKKSTYPYTIEFEYTEVNNMTLFYPTWLPVDTYYTAIQKARFSAIVPQGNQFFHKDFNISNPETQSLGTTIVLNWEISDFSSLRPERHSVSFLERVPRVLTRPNKFVVEEFTGSQESWESFGKWMWELNKGQDILPVETVNKIKNLVMNLETKEEKIRAVYKYLQDNTRYVSVQLGIGGWRPIPANLVDEMGYGDCKGLSNYMIALLKSIDIQSNYVVIKSGADANPLITDFPSSQFDHVIVSVPMEMDTIWLECTSQTIPFGYLGSFTGNRDALAVTENGGKIVKTKKYDDESNQLISKAWVNLESSGKATASSERIYKGLLYEKDNLDGTLRKTKKDQTDWLNENINIPNFEILEYNFQEFGDILPSIKQETKLQLERFSAVSGKRLFFKPNLLSRHDLIRQQMRERKTDLYFRLGFVEMDTIEYSLPQDFHPEFLPEPVSVESKFGNYKCSVILSEDKLIYVRRASFNSGRFSKDLYQEWVEFNKKISDFDNMQIVLVNKT